jgi:hypothetical protein
MGGFLFFATEPHCQAEVGTRPGRNSNAVHQLPAADGVRADSHQGSFAWLTQSVLAIAVAPELRHSGAPMSQRDHVGIERQSANTLPFRPHRVR